MLFSRNPIEKPSRLTPVGTRNSLLRLQNHLFTFFIRVRRICFKMASQIHDLVSNDPILDSKVVPDELGQLAEPGRPGLASKAAGPARRAGQAAWRAGGLLPGKGTREERRRWRSAQELMKPPHSYHRRWVILYKSI